MIKQFWMEKLYYFQFRYKIASEMNGTLHDDRETNRSG